MPILAPTYQSLYDVKYYWSIIIWMFCVALLIFAMVIVGGATRLTDSGLSITEWKPILGAIPPLSLEEWLLAFEKYKAIPEYQLVNKGMSLEEFKVIFWWEWGHRFLGRIIGIIYAVPFFIFALMGCFNRRLFLILFLILCLGGLQGYMGWFMVQSGLVERVDVSHYRLAMHLSLAAVIFALIIWVGSRIAAQRYTGIIYAKAGNFSVALIVLCLFQIVSGAFVAGLDAGKVYNTWPLMDGHFIPDQLFLETGLNAIFSDHMNIQFIHRMIAYLLCIFVIMYGLLRFINRSMRVTSILMIILVFCQAGIGILTLLWNVPVSLALVHQAGAFALLAVLVHHRACFYKA